VGEVWDAGEGEGLHGAPAEETSPERRHPEGSRGIDGLGPRRTPPAAGGWGRPPDRGI